MVLCGPGTARCFDSPRDGPRCCPETQICKREDFQIDDPVTCGGVEYPNQCTANCFGCCQRQCLVDPCEVNECPRFPNAECVGGCCGWAFILDGENVTDRCDEEPRYV